MYKITSKYKASRVYLALNDRREDNNTPYLFVSEDYGRSWKPIARICLLRLQM
jgi:hypothetical protein